MDDQHLTLPELARWLRVSERVFIHHTSYQRDVDGLVKEIHRFLARPRLKFLSFGLASPRRTAIVLGFILPVAGMLALGVYRWSYPQTEVVSNRIEVVPPHLSGSFEDQATPASPGGRLSKVPNPADPRFDGGDNIPPEQLNERKFGGGDNDPAVPPPIDLSGPGPHSAEQIGNCMVFIADAPNQEKAEALAREARREFIKDNIPVGYVRSIKGNYWEITIGERISLAEAEKRIQSAKHLALQRTAGHLSEAMRGAEFNRKFQPYLGAFSQEGCN
jgi:hypothetical protein